ncbi:MAG: cation diffusion facilitator family transporter [SAR86 cluster bacterium]|jgi:cobalt-zinc-cadmium efflux system protein|nr:cation diffusion facilitator family transporter [SAR86 cluster bacterium]HIC27383.1 cation transporter [Gammaproteobacteria bacterium]
MSLKDHQHHHRKPESDRGLLVAVGINVLLTFAQIMGGIISGSLSLIADALHNLSDAASLGIALFARKISRKPADEFKTFGYQRAEVIAALINLTLLITISLYLIYEAIWRIVEPQVITGWIMVLVAGIALIVDTITALITYKMSKSSINMKAAFLHNLADALASIGVILAGSFILLYEWYWVDTLVTFFIAGFVLWQGLTLLPKTIHLLMEGTPEDLSSEDIKLSAEQINGVEDVHHIHVWHLDEHRIALEAHVVVTANELKEVEVIKDKLKQLLKDKFNITHSTLEFEHHIDANCDESD